MAITLVTGGVRSGKSVVAEAQFSAEERVVYVATGRPTDPSDPEWSARVDLHQQRRPSTWATIESTDLATVFSQAESPLLVDCLGTWLTAQLDELDAWNQPTRVWSPLLNDVIARTIESLTACQHRVVLVSNEVGWGLVSEHKSGRIFADQLGWLNQRVAAVAAEVLLVVAGRGVRL